MDRPPHRVVFNALTAWPRLAALFALLIAGPAFAGQVTLTWDPVASPLLAGYRVHYGPAAGNYAWSVDAGNTTVLQVGSLTEGATYHFAVTAYDATGGESAYSNDVGTVIPYTAPYTAPVAAFSANVTSGTAPLALTFLNQSTGNITAYKWDFGDGTNGTTENPTHDDAFRRAQRSAESQLCTNGATSVQSRGQCSATRRSEYPGEDHDCERRRGLGYAECRESGTCDPP